MIKKKLWVLLILLFAFKVNYGAITIRPETAFGKDVNGNRGWEIIPFRTSWKINEEWTIKGGMSVNYTKPRNGGSWNHYSQGILLKVEYKPVKFLEKYVKIGSLSDLTTTFTKSFSKKYEGNDADVSYIVDDAYERVGLGFNITW